MRYSTSYQQTFFINFLTVVLLATGLIGCDSPSNSNVEVEKKIKVNGETKIITTESGLEIKMTDLGTLGGAKSRAESINDNGQIVGTSLCGINDRKRHAFLWENGEMTDLAPMVGEQSIATSINQQGAIVGFAKAGTEQQKGFLWKNNTLTDLCDFNIPQHINDQGQIVGTGDKFGHATLWEDGEFIDLGTLGGTFSYASSINNNGQIAGSSWPADESRSHAVLWKDGVMTELGTLGGGLAYAFSINDHGLIVGQSDSHAFLWEDNAMSDLGALEGGNYSTASSINEKGQIVGQSQYSEDPQQNHAVLWLKDGTLIDLGTLGGANLWSWALSINNNGQIVGFSETPDGEQHAVLWEIME